MKKIKRNKIFYGWYIVAASSLNNGIAGSVHWKGFTVFFIPISQSLGLSSAQTAIPFALSRAENGLLGPITGWLLDKYGVKRLMLIGTFVTGIGYILLSFASTFMSFLIIYLFVISLGSSTAFMQASMAAINKWFIRKRGIAMSINNAAFRLGGALLVPLLSVSVLNLGWEKSSMIVGIMIIVVIMPLSFIFKKSPESVGLYPDGEKITSKDKDSKILSIDDWTTKDAMKTKAYWLLVLATMFRIAVHGTIFLHFIPILVWKGETQQASANLIGLLALFSVPLIIMFGWLGDKYGRPKLLFLCYTAAGLSLFFLNQADSTTMIFLVLLLFSGSEIGSGMNWSLVGDFFGREHYATIRGSMAPIYNIALFTMPIAAGWIKDTTDSYEIVLISGSIMLIFSAIVFSLLKKPIKKNYGRGDRI
ncbi:MAG: MFS transporter [SAR202 cluster bacterium]|nr:MFS transporter [SAR202 cluster bacterium]